MYANSCILGEPNLINHYCTMATSDGSPHPRDPANGGTLCMSSYGQVRRLDYSKQA
jgi:hypothetical protein